MFVYFIYKLIVFRYLLYLLSGISLSTIFVFNIERLSALLFSNHQNNTKSFCRGSLKWIYIFLAIIGSDVCFIIIDIDGYCFITYTPTYIQYVLIWIYQGILSTYLLIGVIILPIMCCTLTRTIYKIKVNSKILQNSWQSGPVTNDVKITKQLILWSIYTSICLVPLFVWILRGANTKLCKY